jgi:hypothetical protein
LGKPFGVDRRENQGRVEAKKLATAAIYVATTDERPALFGQPLRKCKFAEALNYTGLHPPWRC